jgi:RNA polymerase sigma-70 factor (ECF subfamily)
MHDEPELKDLAAGIAAGRREAWERLYTLTHLPLLRLLRRLLRDEGRAEEALQASFVTAIERVSTFDPARGSPDAWLAGIARHKAQESFRAARPAVSGLNGDVAAKAHHGGGASGDGADGELVELALDGLEPRYAEVLRRKYLGGETIETIAHDLDLKPATVGTLLHRGKERFRSAYERLRFRAEAPCPPPSVPPRGRWHH